MPALSNLYEAAGEIRMLLMPFAFTLCVIGIGEMGWRAGSDTRAILGALVKTILIVGLIAGYPTVMKAGQEAFMGIRHRFTDARDAKFIQLLRSRIENQPSDSWTELGKTVPAAIGYFFQGIGRCMLVVLQFFQEFAIAGLIAVSPLLIGFLFFSYTQSLGVHFGVTSLTVLLWHVAICLVDIVIQAISDLLFLPITTGGLVQVAQNLIVVNNWLHFPLIMAITAFITIFFYLSVPFVASAVMKGLSGTTAAMQAGVQGAAGMIVGTGLAAAGAASTFGGSAAAQAAIEGTKLAADTASSSGRITHDIAGMVTGSMGQGTTGGGSSSPNVPPPPTGAGESRVNASNPTMVAHQTAPNAFAVVDQDRSTVSHHRGNISTPYAAQAAFNAHAAKAQPLPPDSPLASSRKTPLT
jgi:hypothetical protein